MKKSLAVLIAFAPLLAFAQGTTATLPGFGQLCEPPNTTCQAGLTCNFQTNLCDCPSGEAWNSTYQTCEATGSSGIQPLQQQGAPIQPLQNQGAPSSGLNTSLLSSWANSITGFINSALMPLFVAIAFIVFLYGIFKYFIWGAADEEQRATGRQFVMYGILGFVLIFSLWGIIAVIRGVLQFPTGVTHPDYPSL